MKTKLFISALIALALGCNLSCDTNSDTNYKHIKEFETSLETWKRLKLEHGTSYTYEMSSGSVFGFGSTTKITVENNIVISRTFESYSIYDDSHNYLGYENRLITSSYNETSETIGTHVNGTSPLTIDELYDTCLNNYLSVDTRTNQVTFAVDDLNVLKDCYYIANGCQDDCSTGIMISKFDWLGLNTN
ncbi:hypothetical protein [Confluentibacter sediminis]|uniref:hypothetical protein n=1 Tax=Confluentibacter sediminis TaxID=2219045 RepID=UPI000DAC3D4D|nr:hypothetical protein [Confluentibacter sediminis]